MPEIPANEFFDQRIPRQKNAVGELTGDESQQKATRLAKNKNPLLITDGPPGAGKTTVIAEIIRQALAEGKQILVVSQTNTAIDNIIEEFKDDTTVPLARLGNNVTGIMTTNKDVYQRFSFMKGDRNNVLERMNNSTGKVVVATNTGIKTNEWALQQLGINKFDLIIMDESSRADLVETSIPLQFLRKGSGSKCIFVGDIMQLRPFGLSIDEEKYLRAIGIRQESLDLFKKSILEVILEDPDFLGDRVMLSTNYRSHPLIAQLISYLFYNNRLNSRGWEYFDETTLNFRFVDIGSTKNAGNVMPFFSKKDDNGSSFNNKSADEVVQLVHNLTKLNYNPDDMMIVTPYIAQNKLIMEKLKELGIDCWLKEKEIDEDTDHDLKKGIEITTIDAVQGREAEGVIFDLVKSVPDGNLGFIDVNKFDVAFSRAKNRLGIIADSRMLQPRTNDPFVQARDIFAKTMEFYNTRVKVFFPDASDTTDEAQEVGGIDLGDDHLTLNIKTDGSGLPLALQFQDAAIKNIPGLTPVIQRITAFSSQNIPALADLFATP